MNRESVAAGVAGILFGLLVGWILGSQAARQAPATAPAMAQSSTAPATAANSPSQARAPAPLDQARVDELTKRANANPRDAGVRTQIANLYFDAERYNDAIKWYEASLALEPGNPDVSTDLGVSYYYTNQPDRALAQFARSLEVDPRHTKTMLNVGVVRAFGKQDLEGAAAAWRKVVELAPDTAEGRAARQMIEALRQAHPEISAGAKEGA
jgi:tetratricopeptide (TPR) repeat protein